MGLYDDILEEQPIKVAPQKKVTRQGSGLFDDLLVEGSQVQAMDNNNVVNTLNGFTPNFGNDEVTSVNEGNSVINNVKNIAKDVVFSTPEASKQFLTRAIKSYPEFSKGLNDLVALVGDKTGLQGVSDFGRSNAQFWQEQSDKIQINPKYQGLKGLTNATTILPTITGSIGDQASNLLMAGGGAGAGAKAAAGLGVKGVAKASLITAGTAVPNLAQEGQYLDKIEAFKNIYGRMPNEKELKKIQNIAIGEKAVNTALETVADKLLFAKLFPQGVVTKNVNGILKNAGQQALTEAGTEGMQESVSIGAESLLGLNQGDNLERLIDSMAIGGITGGVMGGVSSAVAQPYNTQFVENQNQVNYDNAVKNVSAQIVNNKNTNAFDSLRTLSKNGAFSNNNIAEIAPNIAKSIEEQKAVNHPTENVHKTVASVGVEQSKKADKKAKAKAKAIAKIKELAPNTAKQMETPSNFVKDNDGVYEKVGENQLRNVDTNEIFTPANPKQYSEWKHDPNELMEVKEFKYDAKSKNNADNYANSKQEVIDSYNNYIKSPTQENSEIYQEAYGKATEEYHQKEETFKKNDKLTQIAPKTVEKMQKENSIEQSHNTADDSITDEQKTKLVKLEQEYAKRKALIGKKPLDNEQKGKELKGAAMEYAAKKREIIQGDSLEPVLGGLTSKELAKKKAYAQSNHNGKEVYIDNKKAKVVGNIFGKVKVQFEDGTTKTVESDMISNKPTEPGRTIYNEEFRKINDEHSAEIARVYGKYTQQDIVKGKHHSEVEAINKKYKQLEQKALNSSDKQEDNNFNINTEELISKAKDLGVKGNLKAMKPEKLKTKILEAETKVDLQKHIYEGWTVEDFIENLEPLVEQIYSGRSIVKPFKNRQELKKWCMDNQPYYKNYIPDVVNYFANKYNIPNTFVKDENFNKVSDKVKNIAPNTANKISKRAEMDEKIEKAKAYATKDKFIPKSQKIAMVDSLKGEEKEYFATSILKVQEIINNSPEMYQTQSESEKNIKPVLHYFGGSFDLYVTEVDKETGDMYGFGGFNQDYEWGYNNVSNFNNSPHFNLDLHYDNTKSVADIWKKQDESEGKNEHLESNSERRQAVSNEDEKPETGIRGTEENQSETGEILRGNGQQELRQSELPGRTGISKKDLEIINKSYKNQHELNTAIEEYINNGEYKKYPGAARVPQAVKDWLKKYTGAGGLEKQGAEGKGLLTEYYTPQNVVNKMWELTAQYVNTDGANVLEPSVGIGRFLENAPKNTSFDVFEMNPVTARITKILYPNANVETGEFQKKFIDSSKNLPVKSVNPEYDIVIGNPPYGKYNSKYKGMGEGAKYEQLESYFINRGLDTLKENGVLTYIVPSSFLRGQKGKLEIANKCELLDAYRLPNGTFGTTDIGTDIIILRKRTGKTEARLFSDSWFKAHPEKILGEVQQGKGNWGTDLVKGDKNAVNNIKVGKKDIKETVAKDINVPRKNSVAKKSKTTTEENLAVQKGKVEYTEYKHENRATEREMELWQHTGVDGSLVGDYVPGEDINQYNGKLYNDFNYLQGDIYEKLDDLKYENISEEQRERQKKKLLAVLPKKKEANEISFNPTSDFIQDFDIDKAEEVRWGKKKSPVVQGFIDYINQIPSDYRDDFSSRNIEAYLTGSRIDFRIKFDSKSPEYAREKSKKMSKLKAIVEKHFTNYVAKVLDKDTRERLVDEWNRSLNHTYNPDYTKMPLLVKDLNSKFKGGDLKLKETQIEGINFLANKGVGLIGFEVGVGKTLTGIISTVQNMQMGRCKRPLIIIPKNIKKNWKEEFAETFPNIKVVDVDNMSKWDGHVEDGTVTLATYQALDNLWYNKSDEELTNMIYKLGNDFNKESTKRGKESVKERFEKMVGKALKGNKARFTVEDLGFDHVTFDEAHAGKNLFDEARADSMEKDAGGKSVGTNTYFNMRGGSQSKVALRMFLLTQHILNENNNSNVFMLTATPFNNQSLEVFNMLSYLAKDKLDKMGLYNVYQFNEQFIDVTSDIVLDANNNPIEKQVELGFKNVGALREIIKSCMLIRTADDAKVVRPNKFVTRQKLDPTEEQLYWFDQADEIAMDKSIDGALFKSISMRRNATISPDVAANNFDVSPEDFIKNSPKLEYIMRCVESMKNKDAKTSQIIYMPIGVKFLGKIKQYLVDKGVYKANEIEIISSENALSNPEKEEARISKITDSFNDREGDVKLIIGTQKIQVGMNLNKNTSTLYIPYVEWNPTDFVQTVGRMWRQGNSYKNVRVVVPLLKNSSDSFMFQKLDEKIKRMNDLIGSDKEYIDNEDLQTEEEKIAMISNPYKRAKMYTLLQKDKIDFEIKKLQARITTVAKYKSNLESKKRDIEYFEREIKGLEELKAQEESLTPYQTERLKEFKKSLNYAKKAVDSINAQIELDGIEFDGKDSELAIGGKIEKLKKEQEKLNELEQQKADEYSVEYENERQNIKSIDEHIAEFEKEYDELYSDSDSVEDIDIPGFMKNQDIVESGDLDIDLEPIYQNIKQGILGEDLAKLLPKEISEKVSQYASDYSFKVLRAINKNNYGTHRAKTKSIELNLESIGNNPYKFIRTLVHELEHAKQKYIYDKIILKSKKSWSANERTFVAYYNECKEVNKKRQRIYALHKKLIDKFSNSNFYSNDERVLAIAQLSKRERDIVLNYDKAFSEYRQAKFEIDAKTEGEKYARKFRKQSRFNGRTNTGKLSNSMGINEQWSVGTDTWDSSPERPSRIRTNSERLGRIKGTIKQVINEPDDNSEYSIGLSSFKKREKIDKIDIEEFVAEKATEISSEILDYDDVNEILPKVKKPGSNIVKKLFTPISSRLEDIHPQLKHSIRRFEFEYLRDENEYSNKAKPFIEKLSKMPESDYAKYDLALKNGSAEVVSALNKKYGLESEYKVIRNILDNIRKEAIDVEMEVGLIENYFPREVINSSAILENYSKSSYIRKYLKEIDPTNSLSNDEKLTKINSMLRGTNNAITATSSFTKGRKIDTITKELNVYYKDSKFALVDYITRMNNAIKIRKFFGKGENLKESIGSYTKKMVDSGIISPADEAELKSILKARFSQKGVSGIIASTKNIGYLTSMGNPMSAITQIGDLAFSFYKNGIWNSLLGVKNAYGKNRISKEDLNITRIAQEFESESKTAKLVDKVFKVVGLNGIDRLGKETFINASFEKFQNQAKKYLQNKVTNNEFHNYIQEIFGKNSNKVINELANGKVSDDVKYLLFCDISDYQPISLSEMPETYLTAGNGRIFYMLKTYSLKLLDVYRTQVFRQMKTDPIKGIGNMIRLSFYVTLLGVGADSLKDFLMGREINLEETFYDNILKLAMLSKYKADNFRRDGLGKSLVSMILPPTGLLDDLYKDVTDSKLHNGTKSINDIKTIRNIPVAGKMYYWWFGGGREVRDKEFKSNRKKEFTKALTSSNRYVDEKNIYLKYQKAGLSAENYNKDKKQAFTDYKTRNTKQYKQQFIKAMEKQDKVKIQRIADNMREHKLPLEERKRIYDNAYKEYMKGVLK